MRNSLMRVEQPIAQKDQLKRKGSLDTLSTPSEAQNSFNTCKSIPLTLSKSLAITLVLHEALLHNLLGSDRVDVIFDSNR